jgi:hypothetical protein
VITPLTIARLRAALVATPDGKSSRVHKDDLRNVITELESQQYERIRNEEVVRALRTIGEAMGVGNGDD